MKIDLFEGPRGDRPFFALVLLLSGVFVLALQDSLVKLMSSQTSFWQFQTLRSFGNLLLLVILSIILLTVLELLRRRSERLRGITPG